MASAGITGGLDWGCLIWTPVLCYATAVYTYITNIYTGGLGHVKPTDTRQKRLMSDKELNESQNQCGTANNNKDLFKSNQMVQNA